MRYLMDVATLFPLNIILAIPLLILCIFVADFNNSHGSKIIVRFAVGLPLDGKHRTDCGFFRKGNKAYHSSGHATKWAHLPHYKRMLIRWTIVTFVVLLVIGYLKERTITVAGFVLSIFAGLIFLSFSAIRKVQNHQHTATFHTPMSAALSPMLGVSQSVVDDTLSIRSDYSKAKPGEKLGTLVLPDAFAANPTQKEQIEHLITSRMGYDLFLKWNMSHAVRTLEVFRQYEPPSMVPFLKMLPKIRELKRDLVALGVTAKGELKTWEMASEEPMMFVSATTRRGKTRLAMLLMAQILNRGGKILAIDPKSIGLDEFCAGHPNAIVCADGTNVQAMWDAIHEFVEELNERIAAFKKDRTITFPRMTLILDEVSIFAQLSNDLWQDIKPAKAKAIPPVWRDISRIIFMGAQFNVNACIFGQRVDFRTLAGLIDGFGTRLLAGFTPQTYKRLIDIQPICKSQKPRGRFLYYNNGDDYPVWIQVIYGEIEDMREFALEPVKSIPGVPEKRIPIENRKDAENAT
jgi:hypothetical protein